MNFDYLWPSDLWSIGEQEAAISRQDAVKSFRICGKDAPRGYWVGSLYICPEILFVRPPYAFWHIMHKTL